MPSCVNRKIRRIGEILFIIKAFGEHVTKKKSTGSTGKKGPERTPVVSGWWVLYFQTTKYLVYFVSVSLSASFVFSNNEVFGGFCFGVFVGDIFSRSGQWGVSARVFNSREKKIFFYCVFGILYGEVLPFLFRFLNNFREAIFFFHSMIVIPVSLFVSSNRTLLFVFFCENVFPIGSNLNFLLSICSLLQ